MSSLLATSLTESLTPLRDQERAVLKVLVDFSGRVVSRQELARRSGLSDRCERRCDAVLVQIRRYLGESAIRTVRSRGWILLPSAVDDARRLLA